MKDVIVAKNLNKKYIYWQEKPSNIKAMLVNFCKGKFNFGRREDVEVLDDVSFTIKEGEFVGIMGRNGVGKTTLLKLIAGIYQPTSGSLIVNGSVAPLTALGAGFHEELSGYENIYLNGAILGFGKTTIEKKIEKIIDFSELGKFIYMPVKNYSSGMLLRLGFSIAAFVDSPIVLIDEVLGVGDVKFQKKCLSKIREMHKDGRTIILVTHYPEPVIENCSRCIVFSNKNLVFDGNAKEGVEAYLNSLN